MKKCRLYLFLQVIIAFGFYGQRPFSVSKDIFGTRVFIENKGQFMLPGHDEDIKFAFNNSEEHIYFTPRGLIYHFVKHYPITEEQAERAEKGKKVKLKPDENYYVEMSWKGSNSNIQIVEEQKVSHYFTSGDASMNAAGYKKLTYKNVYNNIDIEYFIPEEKATGIKYNVLVHPGGNPEDVKILYTGDVKGIGKKGNDVVIKTPLESITEHAPESFYGGQKLKSHFLVNEGAISFGFENLPPAGEELVIDPWVTTLITPFPVDNTGFETDFDYQGNMFVYGHWNKVAKYDPQGNLLWVFQGVVPALNWGPDPGHTGSFGCNKATGKVYLGEARVLWAGARIIRLDQSGNYDNFVTPLFPNAFVEIWNFGYNCMTGDMIVFGGYNGRCSIINQQNATIAPAMTGNGDYQDNAIDDAGNIFGTFTSNRICQLNTNVNGLLWNGQSTMLPSYGNSKNLHINPGQYSQAFNNLAANNFYLFTYSGYSLTAYSKTNGAIITTTAIPGYTAKMQSGIAADNCNNIYIGGIGNILCFNYNGTSFTQLPSIPLGVNTPNQYVYDVHLSKNNLLYVCGSGFAGVYSAIYSNTCSPGVTGSVSLSCNGVNTGSAIATATSGIPNALFNYVWTLGNNTVSATMNTTATVNPINNLTNGLYTVQIQANAPCGPVFITTVNVNCCVPISVNSVVVQTSCTNTLNSISLSASGAGTVIPAVTWSPAPLSVAGNSMSASGLSIGINTITLDYGYGCITTLTANMLSAPPPLSFSISNLSNSNIINCYNPAINLMAVSNYTFGSINYTWTSPSLNANTQTVSVTQSGSVTLTGIDPATGCSFQQVIAIGVNTAVPVNSVNPVSQAINCSTLSTVTFTGSSGSPTVNVQNDWYSPLNPLPGGVPVATSNNSISLLSGNMAPGVYTLVTTDLVNGCKAYKTVTVTSLDAWPTFSVNCPTNYSIGCVPLNQTTISIVNPMSTQIPAATCSFTFLPPGFGGVISPTAILGSTASTITTVPGTWTLVVQDNSNFCRIQLAVPIIQNTVVPNVAASLLTQTLTCYNPTILATGTSSTSNTTIGWQMPASPPLVPSPTIIIGQPSNGPNTSTTSLSYASYTVVATNTVNACQNTSVVIINQNFKPPVSSPVISLATPTAIYCTAHLHPAVLTAGGSTTTSGGGPTAFVANPCWSGPSPQTSTCGPSSYSCFVPGVYTLTVMDNYNGCTSSATINVLDRTQPPVLTNPVSNATLDCGSNQAGLFTAITGASANLMYWYYEYPQSAAFSPSAAPVENINTFLNGTSSASVNVSASGIYQFFVTNTVTGCQTTGTFIVSDGNINADITANPSGGFAPLNVSFTNNSASSLGSSSITSIWSFGNGIALTTTTNTSPSVLYNAAGTYTVMLVAQKGSCMDTAYTVVKVDLPSNMDFPNVFTPNGDGNNDLFFLKTTNISEIHAIIFDRWGNKVYETSSSTGNISWDGKNFNGKECADGTYFYIITGQGRDDKHYEKKGNVSIYR